MALAVGHVSKCLYPGQVFKLSGLAVQHRVPCGNLNTIAVLHFLARLYPFVFAQNQLSRLT